MKYHISTQLRQRVSDGMLKTYSVEVPLFKVLYDTIRSRNEKYFSASYDTPQLQNQLAGINLEQLGNIRHAAVRLALPEEMEMFTRIMSKLGQVPVGYYDLTSSGTPVKSTAFRPIDEKEILENAFTIFSSVLDVEALDFTNDPELKQVIHKVLEERKSKHFQGEGAFSKELIALVGKSEIVDLSKSESAEFVKEVINIFQLGAEALVDKTTYERIKAVSPVAADIIGAGLNINHLTPDTPDIKGVYEDMKNSINPLTGEPITMNGFIYGPKGVDILLQQTSFKAVTVEITTPDGELIKHQARFGEVESRGMAVSITGRERYDKVLKEINEAIEVDRAAFKKDLGDIPYKGFIRDAKEAELGRKYIAISEKKFPATFPSSEKELAFEGLVYFKYKRKDGDLEQLKKDAQLCLTKAQCWDVKLSNQESYNYKIIVQELVPLMECFIDFGIVEREWIKYRDFLPASAAGIFSSNRDQDSSIKKSNSSNMADWYRDEIGVINFYDLYEHIEAKAILDILNSLKEGDIDESTLMSLHESIAKGDPDRIMENHQYTIISRLHTKFVEEREKELIEPLAIQDVSEAI